MAEETPDGDGSGGTDGVDDTARDVDGTGEGTERGVAGTGGGKSPPSDGTGGASGDGTGEDLDGTADGTADDGGQGSPNPAPVGNDYAVGNSGGAPKGNDNAVGNAGGSPAPQNQNATKHGLYADPDNVLADLRDSNPEAYAWVESKVQGYLADAPFEDGTSKADQLRQVAVDEYCIWRARGVQVREGLVTKTHERTSDGELVEVESEHPVNLPRDRMQRTVLRQLKELGIYDDEGQGSAGSGGLESDAYRIVDVSDSSESDESED